MVVKQLVILGAGGHGREILNIIEACNRAGTACYDVLGYIVEARYSLPGTLVNGKPILGDFSWLESQAKELYAVSAVGSPALKQRLVEQARQCGLKFESVIYPGTIFTGEVKLSEGVVIGAGCILTCEISLGQHVHLNVGCTISHDVVIEDFATVSPGVNIAGNVYVERGCFIGLGAKIIERQRIGRWSIIGAGSVIIQSVSANVTVAGVPARVIKIRPPGWELFPELGLKQEEESV